MILVSACLLGVNCQYKEDNDLSRELLEFLKDKGEFIAVYPEVLGGMFVPRDASEIEGGSGEKVISGKASVKSIKGKNVTKEFLKGAERVLEIAKQNKVDLAILKAKSPSCGAGLTYDGTFSKILVEGDGVTAALLKKHSIKVITEKDL